jgi:hypothetical protein
MSHYTDGNGKPRFFFSKNKRILAAIEGAAPHSFHTAEQQAESVARVEKLLDKYPTAMALINDDVEFREYALYYGTPEYISLLLDRGFDLTRVDSWGRAPLQQAVEASTPAIVTKMLDLGADPRVVGPLHMIATHVPARDNDKALIRLLVSRGADVNAVEDMRARKYAGKHCETTLGPEPCTPLDVAMWQARRRGSAGTEVRHSSVVRTLIELGAVNSPGFDAAAQTIEAESKRRDEREWGARNCQAGFHEWVGEGIRTYYSSGRAYKSEVSGYVCKWCRTKQG